MDVAHQRHTPLRTRDQKEDSQVQPRRRGAQVPTSISTRQRTQLHHEVLAALLMADMMMAVDEAGGGGSPGGNGSGGDGARCNQELY